MSVRFLKQDDLQEVYSIICYYIDHSTANFSWKKPEFEEFCAEQLAIAAEYPYLVAEYEGKVIGFGYAHAFLAKPAYQYDAELTIYFAQGNHHGLAGELYEKLEAILKDMGICCLITNTTANNQESLAYQAKYGFKQFGMLPDAGFKNGKWHGIVWQQKRISHTDAPKRIPLDQVRRNFE